MAIRPKEGRYYKDGIGRVRGPILRASHANRVWEVSDAWGDDAFDASGAMHGALRRELDLVSECDWRGKPIGKAGE